MSVHGLESEDLENVPLVRMEDVQPSRERTYEVITGDSDEESVEEVLGSCVIEDIVYDTEYIVNNDDDSNIGSMVSIKSEEVVEDEEAEMIVPEIMEDIPNKLIYSQSLPESSWPTLEILPGGVIKKPDNKIKAAECTFDDDFNEEGEMMYACAKCPQSFKYLYCLVKHVKWHEDEAKKLKKVNDLVDTKTICTSQSQCKHTKQPNLPVKTRTVPAKTRNIPAKTRSLPISKAVPAKTTSPPKRKILLATFKPKKKCTKKLKS